MLRSPHHPLLVSSCSTGEQWVYFLYIWIMSNCPLVFMSGFSNRWKLSSRKHQTQADTIVSESAWANQSRHVRNLIMNPGWGHSGCGSRSLSSCSENVTYLEKHIRVNIYLSPHRVHARAEHLHSRKKVQNSCLALPPTWCWIQHFQGTCRHCLAVRVGGIYKKEGKTPGSKERYEHLISFYWLWC